MVSRGACSFSAGLKKLAGTASCASANDGLLRLYSVTSTQRPPVPDWVWPKLFFAAAPPPKSPPKADIGLPPAPDMPPIGMPMPLKVATSIQACACGGLMLAPCAATVPAATVHRAARLSCKWVRVMVIRCSGGNPHDSACRARPHRIAATQGSAIQPRHHPPMPIDIDHAAPLCGGAHAVHADHAAARDRAPRLRAGRPDPRAGARAGPDAAPPRARTTAPATWSAATRGCAIEEDCLVNYGFLPREHLRADAPARGRARVGRRHAGAGRRRCWPSCASAAPVHPREVDAHFAHGRVTQLLGRLAQREHAAARRHALPRPAARGAARGRHPRLCSGAATRRRDDSPAGRARVPPRWSS